ncbi:MAG: hypothetical protein SWZ49_00180 [Cyanobacteriota bacterium]|nr:hypothetical protein [Cyanobacteriota bacterium]
MRINLQRFAFSTLTFSLATTLAVGGFSESANARNPSGGLGTSPNVPALNFEIFLENEDGTAITDAKDDDDNLGVFKNAIEIINDSELGELGIFTQVTPSGVDEGLGAEVAGFNNFKNGIRTSASLSAELNGNEITYQIFLGDNYESPSQFLKFAPVPVSSDNDIIALVNDLQFILDDGKEGKYDVISPNNLVDKPEVGVLGRAIDLSLNFQEEGEFKFEFEEALKNGKNEEEAREIATKKVKDLLNNFPEKDDFLKITKFAPQPSTSIPEPTTTLASIFALAFAGKFLRKSKKSNA